MSTLGEDGSYIGGLEANPKRLIAMVLNWRQHNLSISATCRTVMYELVPIQEDEHICAEQHIVQTVSKRQQFPGNSGDKKLDVFGNYCEATSTQAIDAFITTVDQWMS
jgi:hypothetical protein